MPNTPPSNPPAAGQPPGAAPPPAGRQPRNRRLPAHERRDQILDAALHEFSERGFGAARMDDIAARAGLSKGGLYAHFESKDAVFQALMQRMLLPDLLFGERPPERAPQGDARQPQAALADLVDGFLDRAYARLEDDRFIRTLHLLIAEGPRMPDVLGGWRDNHLRLLQSQQALMRRAVESGALRDSALTDMVQLIHAPVLLGAVLRMLQDDEHVRAVLPRLRAAHRRLLLELLPPDPA
ncbi:TetR/AcrR family transcriptional regulator [Castellaniella defragrans]|jgi:AcrR family transcriptional regulator|uniref:AcrR family transcriptional regulator n=1 Tax=Castellaniella defragrans TaxID=75697 RepID=A0A7W9WLD0_CASDE|nr:TetR/AcrR family transcriptional regulator [Castellaniella defragrans]KAB0595844.1 TetR/AcrR family transcriptional regulator [Castellaniella defragrans]MBB6083152.1 AcrR family transcriptional regulator [Castellaniella defragrans]